MGADLITYMLVGPKKITKAQVKQTVKPKMTEIEMQDKAERRLKDLGWGNGWSETPEIIKNCLHATSDTTLRPGVHRVVCRDCGYTYLYDSGDCGT